MQALSFRSKLRYFNPVNILQLYAELEETLYHECSKSDIENGSSIRRFENALNKQNYDVSKKNVLWTKLISSRVSHLAHVA